MKKLRFLLLLLGVGIATNVIAAPPQVPLTVTVQGDGIVTSDPAGINCPSDCSESYKKASTIILTATADPNSNFLGWDGACIGTQPTCEVKILAPTNVTAVFDMAVVTPIAPVLKTRQTLCWGADYPYPDIPCAGTGEDGEYQAGVTQPTPRFIDNGDGTVTDYVTGLTWLQHPRCLRQLTWAEALDASYNLTDGQCNLSDGSIAGDWRLPNAKELQSLSDFAEDPQPGSSISQSPFVYIFPEICGTGSVWNFSSTSASQPDLVFIFSQSILRYHYKTSLGCAFAVKGGL